MKLVKLLPLSILALSLSLASCNNEVRETPQAGETTLELSSSIGHTRVTTQSDNSNHWDGNENIGVYSSSLSASNVLYTAKTAGASTDFTTSTPITIPMGATKHEIKAYYPYDAAANTSVTIDLTKGNVQPLLYATGEVTNATPKLNLNFAHKLGKLRIKVDVTNSLTPSAAVDKVSVAQALTKGTLTIDNGNFTVDQATKADLTLKAQNGEFYTYLMPGETIKDKVITIQHGSKLYKATLTSTKTVEAGKYYLYTITLSNGSAKVEEGTGTIAGESEGETGTVEGAPEGEATPVTPTTVTATLNSSNSAFSNNQLTAPAAGGDFTFTLSGLEAGVAVSATANPTADWITFEGDVTLRAAVDKTFTIKVKANETTEARETTITLKAEGMNDLTFKISQARKEETTTGGEVTEGDGTEAKPYTVAQAIANQGKKDAFVKGYIVGTYTNGGLEKEIKTSSNIAIADTPNETDVTKIMPVQLPTGAQRDAINLVSNPNNKGKQVILQGTLEAYFKVPGLRNVKSHTFVD